MQVEKFNGEDIWTLAQLAKLVTNCTDEFFTFELALGNTLVLDAKQARESTADILRLNNIAQQMSPDLRAAVHGKRRRKLKTRGPDHMQGADGVAEGGGASNDALTGSNGSKHVSATGSVGEDLDSWRDFAEK